MDRPRNLLHALLSQDARTTLDAACVRTWKRCHRACSCRHATGIMLATADMLMYVPNDDAGTLLETLRFQVIGTPTIH